MSNERGNSEQAVVLGLPYGATPRCSLEVQSTVDGHGSACVMVDRARAVGPARNAGKPERMPINAAFVRFEISSWHVGWRVLPLGGPAWRALVLVRLDEVAPQR